MDKTVIIVSAVVGSLGVLSAVLGFIAEGANPFNPSPALGICASIFLLAAQITISAAGGCCGCCKSRAIPSETNRIVGVVCAVISWILAVIALALFFRGAWLNSIGYYLIGLYAGGGVLTLIATALGITSFVMLQSRSAADVEVVAVSAPNWPSLQQPTVIMVAPPQLPAAGTQNKPGEQQLPLPAGVAMGHPLSSQEGKQPPSTDVIPIGHPQSQPSAEVTVNNAATTSQPQAPQSQVYVLQSQSPHPVLQPQDGLAALPRGTKPEKQQTGSIGKGLLNVGAELGVHFLKASLSSDDTDDPLAMAGGALLSMAGGDAGAADSGDATC